MIPVGRDEILSCLAGNSAVLQTLHKLHPTITCKKFHPGKTGSFFCTPGIPIFRDEIFPCNRYGPPKPDEKVNQHISLKISIDQVYSNTRVPTREVNRNKHKSTRGLSMKQITQIFLEGDSPTLKLFDLLSNIANR